MAVATAIDAAMRPERVVGFTRAHDVD